MAGVEETGVVASVSYTLASWVLFPGDNTATSALFCCLLSEVSFHSFES